MHGFHVADGNVHKYFQKTKGRFVQRGSIMDEVTHMKNRGIQSDFWKIILTIQAMVLFLLFSRGNNRNNTTKLTNAPHGAYSSESLWFSLEKDLLNLVLQYRTHDHWYE